jgi:hypothetical protein
VGGVVIPGFRDFHHPPSLPTEVPGYIDFYIRNCIVPCRRARGAHPPTHPTQIPNIKTFRPLPPPPPTRANICNPARAVRAEVPWPAARMAGGGRAAIPPSLGGGAAWCGTPCGTFRRRTPARWAAPRLRGRFLWPALGGGTRRTPQAIARRTCCAAWGDVSVHRRLAGCLGSTRSGREAWGPTGRPMGLPNTEPGGGLLRDVRRRPCARLAVAARPGAAPVELRGGDIDGVVRVECRRCDSGLEIVHGVPGSSLGCSAVISVSSGSVVQVAPFLPAAAAAPRQIRRTLPEVLASPAVRAMLLSASACGVVLGFAEHCLPPLAMVQGVAVAQVSPCNNFGRVWCCAKGFLYRRGTPVAPNEAVCWCRRQTSGVAWSKASFGSLASRSLVAAAWPPPQVHCSNPCCCFLRLHSLQADSIA